MSKEKFLLVILLWISIHFQAFGQLTLIESMSMYSNILNKEIRFSILLPTDYYKTTDKYSTVYLLHGLGDNESSWIEYGEIDQIAKQLWAENEIIPMIFVMPQGFNSYYTNTYDSTFMYRDMFTKELVPYIDGHYRTLSNRNHRALLGYSMGGFGAMSLALKNPELFSISVPMSMSVRTQDQYETENAEDWDQQWGRIFGGVGTTESDRITNFYKANSPFYMLPKYKNATHESLLFYLFNGDREHTLAKSNEELHVLMRNLGISHQYKVVKGGHSFSFWRISMPDALRFISDGFENKTYRGDQVSELGFKPLEVFQWNEIQYPDESFQIYLPADYEKTTRQYPVLYILGNFEPAEMRQIAELSNSLSATFQVPELIIAFISGDSWDKMKANMEFISEKYRIRKGFRFKAVLSYIESVLPNSLPLIEKEEFIVLVFANSIITPSQAQTFSNLAKREVFDRTSLFLTQPSGGDFYEGFGDAHVLLRNLDISHEYRVREGNDEFIWFLQELPEILKFTFEGYHK
jgi:enterochelin esterase-like enzyme